MFAQVIFEHNTIEPGGAELSWGNNIDNYSGGYCQHVCEWAASLSLRRCLRLTRLWLPDHAHNTFKNVWAGDREVMTFDPGTGSLPFVCAVLAF